jgi:hypothetical protein
MAGGIAAWNAVVANQLRGAARATHAHDATNTATAMICATAV